MQNNPEGLNFNSWLVKYGDRHVRFIAQYKDP